jgi:hypothetical protein
VRIEQAVDQVQVAGTAAARTDRQLAGELGLRPGGECSGFFVADAHPIDFAAAAYRVGHRIEAIADDPVDALHARLRKRIHQMLRNGPRHDLPPVSKRADAARDVSCSRRQVFASASFERAGRSDWRQTGSTGRESRRTACYPPREGDLT